MKKQNNNKVLSAILVLFLFLAGGLMKNMGDKVKIFNTATGRIEGLEKVRKTK